MYRLSRDLDGVDWAAVTADLAHDDFDNGRTPEELARSFAASAFVSVAWAHDRVVGTARLLADGVCNAYLVDVWTAGPYRRRGFASAMADDLGARGPGPHVALFAAHAEALHAGPGFRAARGGL